MEHRPEHPNVPFAQGPSVAGSPGIPLQGAGATVLAPKPVPACRRKAEPPGPIPFFAARSAGKYGHHAGCGRGLSLTRLTEANMATTPVAGGFFLCPAFPEGNMATTAVAGGFFLCPALRRQIWRPRRLRAGHFFAPRSRRERGVGENGKPLHFKFGFPLARASGRGGRG
mgnify:CR=1 FL=1